VPAALPRLPMRLPLVRVAKWGVAVGLVLHAVAALRSVPGWDGTYYMVLGDSLAQGRGLLLPWGSAFQGPVWDPVQAQHFAPLWPAVLGGAYSVGGFGLATTAAASFAVAILFLAVVFLATRDLLGEDKAWFVTAFASVDFFLLQMMARAYSENLVAVFYVATIWAILKSLKDPRYVVWAGLLGGLGYLTRASIGYFFLLAGFAGLSWRFAYMRWRVFTDRHYLAAIALFLALVAAWSLRNVLTFGWPHWETSPYTTGAVLYAAGSPLEFSGVLLGKVLLFAAFFALLALFLHPSLRREFRDWREEAVSAHLLAIGLPALLGLIFGAAFTVLEGSWTLFWADNLRYVDIVFVPLLWLALRREPLPAFAEVHWPRGWTRPSPLRVLAFLGALAVFLLGDRMIGVVLLFGAAFAPRGLPLTGRPLLALLLAFGLASVNAAVAGYLPPEHRAGEYLGTVVQDGETIALAGNVNPYFFYVPLRGRSVDFAAWNGSAGADYLVSPDPLNASGYTLAAAFDWPGSPGPLDRLADAVLAGARAAGLLPPDTRPTPMIYVYRFL